MYGRRGVLTTRSTKPSSTIEPLDIAATCVAMCSTTARLWVTKTTPSANFSCKASNRFRICAWTETSSADVGSSQMSSRGSRTSARNGHALALSAREMTSLPPLMLRAQPHERAHFARPLHPLLERPGLMDVQWLRHDIQNAAIGVQRRVRILEDSLDESRPFEPAAGVQARRLTRTLPAAGCSSPSMTLMRVVLPLPDSPSTPSTSPACTFRETSRTTSGALAANQRPAFL